MRYEWLIDIVKTRQPKRILEIGVAQGNTAHQMMKAAPEAEYYGVDLFEDLTAEVSKAEMNGKKVSTRAQVKKRLGDRARLFKGNTNDVLMDLCLEWAGDGIFFDLIFLDGGHSSETIDHDYQCVNLVLADKGLFVFDDYYSKNCPPGFGCNALIDMFRMNKEKLEFSEADSFRTLDIQMVAFDPGR